MAESVDALVSNTNGRKFVPVRSRLWVQWSDPHYGLVTIVGIALLAVGPWCFYTFYYLKSEENHPLIGGAADEKGTDSVLFLVAQENFSVLICEGIISSYGGGFTLFSWCNTLIHRVYTLYVCIRNTLYLCGNSSPSQKKFNQFYRFIW